MSYTTQDIFYRFDDHLSRLVIDYGASRQITPRSEHLYHGLPSQPYDEGLFAEHNVKRGLRNADGSGVVAGLTRISNVHGYNTQMAVYASETSFPAFSANSATRNFLTR